MFVNNFAVVCQIQSLFTMWVLLLRSQSWQRLSKVIYVINEYDVVIQGICY